MNRCLLPLQGRAREEIAGSSGRCVVDLFIYLLI